MARAAWPSYVLNKGWLALRRRLPWFLMDFLDDAHKRGVLRQVGAVYQFRHIDLQHRLAAREPEVAKIGSKRPRDKKDGRRRTSALSDV